MSPQDPIQPLTQPPLPPQEPYQQPQPQPYPNQVPPVPQYGYQAPAGMPQPTSGYPAQPALMDQSLTMPIVGLVLAFFIAPVGLILSIIALRKHKIGTGKILSIIGIIVSGLSLLVTILVFLTVLASFHGLQTHAQNTKEQTDLNTLQAQLEASYANNNASYPTLNQFNDANWRSTNMAGLSPAALSPNSSVLQLVAGQPTNDSYAYNPLPADCQNTTASPCTSYTLSGKQPDGQLLTSS